MKKLYKNPSIKIVMLTNADIITTSTSTLSYGGNDGGSGVASSRGFDDFDMDE